MARRSATVGAALLTVPMVAAGLVVAPFVVRPAVAEEPVCVAVTVDYRDLAGAPGSASTHCAKVPNRSTGYEILVARAKALGRSLPRSEGGLVCAIDGLPERGCAESTEGGYRYWAYFHRQGDGPWQYSNRGAGDYRVIDDPSTTADDRPGEGWVWVDGGGEGTVQPAHVRYDDICPPEARSAPPSATPRPAGTRSPTAGPTAAAPAPSRTTVGRTDAPTVRATATSTAASSRPAVTTSSTSTDPSVTRSATATGAAVIPSSDASSPPPTVGLTGDSNDDSTGRIPTGTLVGVGLVAVVAGAAVLRRRAERAR